MPRDRSSSPIDSAGDSQAGEPPSTGLQIEVSHTPAVQQTNAYLVRQAMTTVLEGEGFHAGSISIAIVDDREIQRLNRAHLNHDYPTDVISFVYQRDGRQIDGEVIVSGETAARESEFFGWSAENELLLYVVHGGLHLAGYLDHTDADRLQMRSKERSYLALLGRSIPAAAESEGAHQP